MSNVSGCIINMQFIHVGKHNLIIKILKVKNKINKLISCIHKIFFLNNKHTINSNKCS